MKTAQKAPKPKRTSHPTRTTRPTAGKARSARNAAPRADFGAPIDGFLARQPAPLRAILDELRTLVEEAAPDARGSIKWGMPFFAIGGAMVCGLGAHRSHVNLILYGPPSAFPDPEGRLLGEGKVGRHLKLTPAGDLPRESVRRWLRTAAELARKKGQGATRRTEEELPRLRSRPCRSGSRPQGRAFACRPVSSSRRRRRTPSSCTSSPSPRTGTTSWCTPSASYPTTSI